MIAVHADTVRLGGRIVLRDIDIRVPKHTLLAVCGPNGAGKTTLLRLLAGLVAGTRPRDPRRVAYLPQGARCAWAMRVEEVAALGRIPHGDTAAGPIDAALRACGIEALRHARIDHISGGEARRAMLARVLATEPEVLLLDEPTADLDPRAQHEIFRMLRHVAGDGRVVIVVVHALEMARRYADRVLVIELGRVVCDAPPAEALPRAAEVLGMRWGVDPEPGLLPQ